ncbi:MAG TPA: SbcC/MukB-like Walker B domain-containing protein, partial [Vulgatibacter sp.]
GSLREPWIDAAAEADRIGAALVRLDGRAPIPSAPEDGRAVRPDDGVAIPSATEEDGAALVRPDDRGPTSAAGEELASILRLIGGLRETIAEREAAAEKLEGEATAARAREAAVRSAKEAKAAQALDVERRLRDLGAREQQERLRLEAARDEGASLLRSLDPVLAGHAQAQGASRDPAVLEIVDALSLRDAGSKVGRGAAPAFGAGDLSPSTGSSAALRGLVDRLAAKVDEWRRHEQARLEGAERLGSLRPRVEAARSLVAERQARKQEADDAALEAERAASVLSGERAGLLGGQPAAAVEGALREEHEAAAKALEEARASEMKASTDLASARALVQAADDALAAARAKLEKRVTLLDGTLSEAGLSLDDVKERLARPQAEVEGWRKTIAALDDDRRKASTLVDERRRAREAHESGARPALDEATARAEAEARKAPCQEAEEAYHDARNALRADDEARERAKAILPELEARTSEAEKWAAMHGLIGSANGDRFQLFAQGITLRVLLAHANVHLEELAPRYRLEKVPGKNLHIQVVDRHMGDDVRAANSLSGGETFLVSLALALGLSGLSSRSRVESLFIDEGFGSLDPHSLDLALATLDSLQATGRKVGVISHVQGMAERIGVQIQVRPQGSGRSAVTVEVR